MTLSYAEKQRIRGMLADKQSAKTIALEFEVGEADVLALAKPKAVHVSQPSGGRIFGKGKNDRGRNPQG